MPCGNSLGVCGQRKDAVPAGSARAVQTSRADADEEEEEEGDGEKRNSLAPPEMVLIATL